MVTLSVKSEMRLESGSFAGYTVGGFRSTGIGVVVDRLCEAKAVFSVFGRGMGYAKEGIDIFE